MKTIQELFDYLTKLADGHLEEDPQIDSAVDFVKSLLPSSPLTTTHAIQKHLAIACTNYDCLKTATLWAGDLDDTFPPIELLIPVAKRMGWEVYYDTQQGEPVFHCPSHIILHGPPAMPLPKITTRDIARPRATWTTEMHGTWTGVDQPIKLNDIIEYFNDDNQWVKVRVYSINAGNTLYQVIPLPEGEFGTRWNKFHPVKQNYPPPTIDVFDRKRIR